MFSYYGRMRLAHMECDGSHVQKLCTGPGQ